MFTSAQLLTLLTEDPSESGVLVPEALIWRATVVVAGLNGHTQESGAVGEIVAGRDIARNRPTQTWVCMCVW